MLDSVGGGCEAAYPCGYVICSLARVIATTGATNNKNAHKYTAALEEVKRKRGGAGAQAKEAGGVAVLTR
jgi:hypothetical protein